MAEKVSYYCDVCGETKDWARGEPGPYCYCCGEALQMLPMNNDLEGGLDPKPDPELDRGVRDAF